MKSVGKCSVGKKKAKEGFEYPIVRFPKEFSEMIGKEAKIYEIDMGMFLISIDEDELDNRLDNSYVLVQVDKNLLERAKKLGININTFLEEKLRELINQCGGWDLNPRTPTGGDLISHKQLTTKKLGKILLNGYTVDARRNMQKSRYPTLISI